MLKPIIRITAVAAMCAAPALGFAQMRPAPSPGTATQMPGAATQIPPASSAPDTSTPDTSAPSAASAASNTNATTPAAAPTVPVTTGLTVKDNTGADIGQVAEVKPDATGKTMVTIKMGARNFQVPATVLAVNNGAATINLTKAQIDAQLPKK